MMTSSNIVLLRGLVLTFNMMFVILIDETLYVFLFYTVLRGIYDVITVGYLQDRQYPRYVTHGTYEVPTGDRQYPRYVTHGR